MFDTSRALADLASQVRACRSSDGLTLQQLANRSGVAASTIHKVEAQQMVPTVSVLLKIAKGLGRRPEELIRDQFTDGSDERLGSTEDRGLSEDRETRSGPEGDERPGPPRPRAKLDLGVWHIDLSADRGFPTIDLAPWQRAIVLVQRGSICLRAGGQRVELEAGGCVEVEGGRVEAAERPQGEARVTLILSPSGEAERALGTPQPSRAVLR